MAQQNVHFFSAAMKVPWAFLHMKVKHKFSIQAQRLQCSRTKLTHLLVQENIFTE
jgi:hypothetical protein